MTTHTGDEGTVKIGANTVAEIVSFSFTETAGLIEDTAKGDTHVTRKAGRDDITGENVCHWDLDDTNGQATMTIGASVTLLLYVEGATTGDIEYSIPAIINEISHDSPEGDSIASARFSFSASAAPTIGTA